MKPTIMEWTQSIVEAIFYVAVIVVCTMAGVIIQVLEECVHLLLKIRGSKKET